MKNELSLDDILNDETEEVQTFSKADKNATKKREVSPNVGARKKSDDEIKKYKTSIYYSEKQKVFFHQAMKMEGINPNKKTALAELINKSIRRDLLRLGIDVDS